MRANSDGDRDQITGTVDWRWGFEPESWMGLRSAKALRVAPAILPEPAAPARSLYARIAAATRALIRL